MGWMRFCVFIIGALILSGCASDEGSTGVFSDEKTTYRPPEFSELYLAPFEGVAPELNLKGRASLQKALSDGMILLTSDPTRATWILEISFSVDSQEVSIDWILKDKNKAPFIREGGKPNL